MAKKKRAPKKLNTQSVTASFFALPRIVVIVILLATTFLVFANSIVEDQFAYDDNTQILKDPFIRSLANVPKAMVTEAWFWRTQQDRDPNKQDKPTTPYYRPVFTVYLMIGWKAFQDWAPGWHLASVLLHMLAVYLAFVIFEEVSGQVMLSGVAALVFAIHPLRSESVAWISGVTDLLLAVFMLGSFYSYLIFRKTGRKRDLILALVQFVIASFCKEPAVSLPLFIVAYELFVARKTETPMKQRLLETVRLIIPFVLVSGFYFAMRFYSLKFLLSDPNYQRYTTSTVILTIPIVVLKYIGLLFWPVNLSIYHETPMVGSPLDVRFIVPIVALGAIAFLLRPAWKNRVARFGILWFVINLIPALNLYAFDYHFLMQERYLYLSSMGFSLLVGIVVTEWKPKRMFASPNRPVAAAVVLIVICLLMTGKTFAQNLVWKDDMTMYIHGAEVADDESMPHFILGHRYIKTFEWDKVVDELEKCVALDPKSIVAENNLANAHLLMFEKANSPQHVIRAAALCQQALENVTPKTDDATLSSLWDTLGHAYDYDTSIRDYNRALACFAQGLKFGPDNPLINAHLGATLIKQNRFAESLQYLNTARKIEPDLPDTYKFLGYAYSNLGQTQNAIDSLNTYLSLVPNAVDAAQERKQVEALQARLQSGNKSVSTSQN